MLASRRQAVQCLENALRQCTRGGRCGSRGRRGEYCFGTRGTTVNAAGKTGRRQAPGLSVSDTVALPAASAAGTAGGIALGVDSLPSASSSESVLARSRGAASHCRVPGVEPASGTGAVSGSSTCPGAWSRRDRTPPAAAPPRQLYRHPGRELERSGSRRRGGEYRLGTGETTVSAAGKGRRQAPAAVCQRHGSAASASAAGTAVGIGGGQPALRQRRSVLARPRRRIGNCPGSGAVSGSSSCRGSGRRSGSSDCPGSAESHRDRAPAPAARLHPSRDRTTTPEYRRKPRLPALLALCLRLSSRPPGRRRLACSQRTQNIAEYRLRR